jgi:hypothetical protein
MSLTKYRIITKLDYHGEQYFQIQERYFFIWFDVSKIEYFGGSERYRNQQAAENQLKKLHSQDVQAEEIRKKRKGFKSKVVYGPYPP